MEVKKMFYTMGEVSEMFDVSTSLVRYWEKQFSVIKPVRNKKGNRLFTPKDVENFKKIYHLVKERGMTLEGAQKALRSGDVSVSRETELMERLLKVRSLLLEVREELKADDDEEYFDDEVAPEVVETETSAIEEEVPMPEVEIELEPQPTTEVEFTTEEEVEAAIEEAIADHLFDGEEMESLESDYIDDEDAEGNTSRPRRPRSTPDGEDKELFAFYEQKLF